MKNIRVGILTFHCAINYGAVLQCYALQKVLERDGKVDVKVINYFPENLRAIYRNPLHLSEFSSIKSKIRIIISWVLEFKSTYRRTILYKKFHEFINYRLNLTDSYTIRTLLKTNKLFDCFIAGSDQIWSLKITNGDSSYFLDFVDKKKRKVSYAASFLPYEEPNLDDLVRIYLPSFNFISVRESKSVEYLSNFQISSICVLDPTLLLNKTFWEHFSEGNIKKRRHKYVLIYLINKQRELLDLAFTYAKRNGFELVSLFALKGRRGYKNVSGSSLEEFVGLIRDAECVFTTSFHGLVLSINLHKEFYFEVPKESYNNNERLLDITRKLGLEDRNISNGISEDKIDWDSVEDKLNVLRKESMDFLYNSIGLNEDEQKDN